MTTQPDRADIPVDSLGNRLGLARKHAGQLSIRAAAELCGIGRGSWQNWERGYCEPRASDLVLIAEGLGVSHEWLARGGPLAQPSPPDDGGEPVEPPSEELELSRCTQPLVTDPASRLTKMAA